MYAVMLQTYAYGVFYVGQTKSEMLQMGMRGGLRFVMGMWTKYAPLSFTCVAEEAGDSCIGKKLIGEPFKSLF